MSGYGLYLPAYIPPSTGSPAPYDLHNARRRHMTKEQDALREVLRGYMEPTTNGVIDKDRLDEAVADVLSALTRTPSPEGGEVASTCPPAGEGTAGSGWRCISTYDPKTSPDICLVAYECGHVTVAEYTEHLVGGPDDHQSWEAHMPPKDEKGEWRFYDAWPVAWQPLPSPPNKQAADASRPRAADASSKEDK